MKKTILTAAMLLIFTAPAFAGGGGGGGGNIVFDPTNFGKNTVTAAEQIKATAQRTTAYATQLEQMQIQLLQAKSLAQGAVAAQMSDVIEQARAANELRKSLTNLYGSVTDIKYQFDARVRDMAMSGLDWQSWFEREKKINARKIAQGGQLLERELAALDRVEKDYLAAREASAKIPESAGVHESMQQLNMSMVKMSMQHGQLIELAALRSRAATEQEQEAAARDQAARTAWEKTRAEQEAMHQKNQADLQEYARKHGGK